MALFAWRWRFGGRVRHDYDITKWNDLVVALSCMFVVSVIQPIKNATKMDTNTQYQENLKSLGFSFDEKNKIAPYFVFYDAWDTGDTKKSIKISLYPELNNGFFTMTCPSKRIMQALFFYNKETIMYVIETIANVKIPVE